MHTHMSLFEGDENAFYEGGDPLKLSKIAWGIHRRAFASRARDHRDHQPDRQLLQATDPRFRGAGVRGWARNNRTALVRIPITKSGKAASHPHRVPRARPGGNPYLAFSVMLAAGMKGIEQGYDLPSEASSNVFELTDEERAAEGIAQLPQSLAEALDAMARSELVAETLGEHIFEWFLRNKRQEWLGYKTQVTQFELDRYLRNL